MCVFCFVLFFFCLSWHSVLPHSHVDFTMLSNLWFSLFLTTALEGRKKYYCLHSTDGEMLPRGLKGFWKSQLGTLWGNRTGTLDACVHRSNPEPKLLFGHVPHGSHSIRSFDVDYLIPLHQCPHVTGGKTKAEGAQLGPSKVMQLGKLQTRLEPKTYPKTSGAFLQPLASCQIPNLSTLWLRNCPVSAWWVLGRHGLHCDLISRSAIIGHIRARFSSSFY